MSMKNLLILLLLVISPCCIHGVEPPPVDAEKVKQRDDGLFYLKEQKKPFTGTSNSHHENGAKKVVIPYKGGNTTVWPSLGATRGTRWTSKATPMEN